MGKALDLIKTANEKHKGIFYYINRKKRRGEKSKKKSAKEWLRIQRIIRIGKSRAKTRRQGSKSK